jgi:hypothetical protein
MASFGPQSADLTVKPFTDEEEALKLAQSEYALGASVFGDVDDAQRFAAKVDAGVVVVNDLIAPTADPRVPFAGRRSSGFGTTRGAEGLLQFTTIKAIVVQRGRRLRHLEPLPENAQQLFGAYLQASHGRCWTERLRACMRLFAAVARVKEKRT